VSWNGHEETQGRLGANTMAIRTRSLRKNSAMKAYPAKAMSLNNAIARGRILGAPGSFENQPDGSGAG
jgi:hypothetical protein